MVLIVMNCADVTEVVGEVKEYDVYERESDKVMQRV